MTETSNAAERRRASRGTTKFETVFRTEWPRVVATLVRDLRDLDLAEDATQEAFVAAADHWDAGSWPSSPGGWLVTTARRKAIDRLRRERILDRRLPDLIERVESDANDVPRGDDHAMVDDQLALLLGCCHPALAVDGQVALTLRIVAGLSTAQIARAFLVSEPTMTRRITRAKRKIRAANIPFEVDRSRLVDRLGTVCAVIYSIFTEGHSSATDASLVRGDLCDEAIWLTRLLMSLVPDDPEVMGLLALLLFSDARRSTRVSPDGSPILLADQDRSRWNRDEIAEGLALLGTAFSAGSAGEYQLQAAIAALHATAPDFESTNWDRIVALYDVLVVKSNDAVTALNRAAAIGHRDGSRAGLAALDALGTSTTEVLRTYPYFHTCRAEFLARSGSVGGAIESFNAALQCATNPTEREHVRQRLSELSAQL